MNQELRNFLREMVSIIIIAFILATVLRMFIVEGRVIPTGSMVPTIQPKDRVMVCKFNYYFKDPQRGDIVVFEPPEELGQKEDFIKRVIGLPGETLEVKDGKVYIDGKSLEEPYIMEEPNYEYGPVKIPEGALFVMGDNRNLSFDSHMWNAWLRESHLKGKAFMTYWPVNRITMLEREVISH
ncbi:MAG: signal peptidase I [Syntrophomonadaceae bacterium]|jgi:signal peptidase I|nr:signal peptidase I [Syntrophomonadaceae bacterium]